LQIENPVFLKFQAKNRIFNDRNRFLIKLYQFELNHPAGQAGQLLRFNLRPASSRHRQLSSAFFLFPLDFAGR
jgi:hypothetical protein